MVGGEARARRNRLFAQTAVEWRVATYQILKRIWESQRQQVCQSAERAVAALLPWGQHIEPCREGWKSLPREDILHALESASWVAEALGMQPADPLVEQVALRAKRFWTRPGRIVSRAFRDSQRGG